MRRRFCLQCETQGEAVTQRKGVLKARRSSSAENLTAGMFYDQGPAPYGKPP